MFKEKFIIILLCLIFISFSSKTVALTKQECADRTEKFKKSENTLNAYIKDLRDDFNNFENEIQNIVSRAKTSVEKIGGNAQANAYKEFSKAKKQLNNKIKLFETILNEHIYMILMVEDCYFNRSLSREKYENLFQLNQ